MPFYWALIKLLIACNEQVRITETISASYSLFKFPTASVRDQLFGCAGRLSMMWYWLTFRIQLSCHEGTQFVDMHLQNVTRHKWKVCIGYGKIMSRQGILLHDTERRDLWNMIALACSCKKSIKYMCSFFGVVLGQSPISTYLSTLNNFN